jgi:neutral ceramidase
MLEFGFAAADITPSVGMEIPGGFAKLISKGVRDKLWAVACVVTDGKMPLALVGIDSLFVTRPTVEKARRLIRDKIPIPGDNVLVGANHTHTGGPVASCFGSDENPEYTDKLAKAIAAAVIDAWQNKKPGELGIGMGAEEHVAFNRRFLMRDGREITHPGKPGTPHHDKIVRSAGPIDPDVGVLAARDGKQKVFGIVVNFACHSTVVGGDQFSPDYAGYLRKHLHERYGENTPVVFLLGACGDLTQVDNRAPGSEFGPEYADMIGRTLAGETIRVINRMSWLKEASTAAAVETAVLSIRPEPDVDRERPAFGLASGDYADRVFAEERKRVAELRSKSPKLQSEVQGLRIGPLGIVTTGAEYFCEHSLRIKECSRLKPTWVVSLANDYIGYVPTAQAFVAGGYEPRTARSSKLAVDAGQILVETALKALHSVV